ncbi:ABC-F family ATP-binding cassette domain-containing protein [Stackebrandtia nassauensis]|uniref:ABC transporter related protein n=1 Tax=Stackebrandtia nassauensis (strain DSM 44728 / CIP 108903 / NRRL B-16338 / NBRC 102104 / LLR-40K-21) TaxID=446470 RepID=D3Q5S9_STANL|nr:ABC-F family ATP-binding cassette domain-containing protein [Stackebrandtia nassauensis]ADD40228.1 ABC transporter related protein [Stackebrandtia nassauensis DSM 44728]
MAVNLVNLEAVGKAFPNRTLLEGVSLGIGANERVGVVGRNGDGKSTLLRVLARDEPADSGRVTHSSGLRLGLLSQRDDLDPDKTVREQVLRGMAEHEWASDAKTRDILTGLFGGLDLPGLEHGLDSTVGPLSGGERRRVALARLLIGEHDLLLLDEPTNHLDIEGIAWLARHVRDRRCALAVVTHDRWFLDEVCTRVWDVQDGNVHEYEGGYSAYVLARAERERIAAVEAGKRANLMRKELAWLRRGPPARTSKPKFRIDAANALIADEPPARDSPELMKFANSRLGKTVFELEDVTVTAGDKTLLTDLTWQLGPGDRIGLVGVNGAGKTSLLRTLATAAREERQPSTGRVVVGKTVKLAYLSQEVVELDETWRVLEAVQRVREHVDLGKGRTMSAGQLCERFGFTGTKQWTVVGDLSGGERRRLQLLRLLMDEPNVLFLDEPTNDLDIETLTQLEDLLDDWPGSMIVVSHDRYFVERTTDTVHALLGDQNLRMLPGGIEEYLERRQQQLSGGDEPTPTRQRAGDSRAAKKEVARIERQLEKLAAKEKDLHAAMAEHATDAAKLDDLTAQLTQLGIQQGELEERWLELASDD